MPEIKFYETQYGIQNVNLPRADANDFGYDIGGAIRDTGQSVDEFAEEDNRLKEAEDRAAAMRMQDDFERSAMKMVEDEKSKTQDYTNFADNVQKRLQAHSGLIGGAKKFHTQEGRIDLENRLNSVMQNVWQNNYGFERGQRREKIHADTTAVLDGLQEKALAGEDPDILNAQVDDITANADHSVFSTSELIDWQFNRKRNIQSLYLKGMIDRDPKAAYKIISGNGSLAPQTMVDDSLINAVVHQESRGNPDAVSSKGAAGIMQVMPSTAREVARQLGDENVTGMSDSEITEYMKAPNIGKLYGSTYLNNMLQRYSGSQPLALAAYNAGPGRVDEWIKELGDPRKGDITWQEWANKIPFEETRSYVSNIMENLSGNNETMRANQYLQGLDPKRQEEIKDYAKQSLRQWHGEHFDSALLALGEGSDQSELSQDQQEAISTSYLSTIYPNPNELIRKVDLARNVGMLKRESKNMTESQIRQTIGNYQQSINKQSPDYVNQVMTLEALQVTQNKILEQRQKDPTGYVFDANKELGAEFSAALSGNDPIAYQQVMRKSQGYADSIGLGELPALPKNMAADMATSFNKLIHENKPAELAATFSQFKETMGDENFARAVSEIVENGGDKSLFAPVLFPRPEDQATLQLIFNTVGNQKEIEKRLGSEAVKDMRDAMATSNTNVSYMNAIIDEDAKTLISDNYYLVALGAMATGKSEAEAIAIADKAVWSRYDNAAVQNYGVFIENDNPAYQVKSVNYGLSMITQNLDAFDYDKVDSMMTMPTNLPEWAKVDMENYRKNRLLEGAKMTTGPDGQSVQLYWTLPNGVKQPFTRDNKVVNIPIRAINVAETAVNNAMAPILRARNIRSAGPNTVAFKEQERIQKEISAILFNHDWGTDPESDAKAIVKIYGVR